jgi:hypothetical protein
MLHPLCEIGKERVDAAVIVGPPNVPPGPRVSATRQGGTGTNREPTAGTPVVNDQVAELAVPTVFLATIRQ